MREGWVTASLGEACVIQSGAGFPKNLQGEANGELPFYKVSDMNTPGNERFMSGSSNYITETVRKDLGAKIFPKGAIVFPKVGGAILTNKKRQITTDSCVDNNIMGLVPKKTLILSDFLRYFMESFDIYDLSNRANPPSIRQSTVANWPILLPPLAEQKRIVAILDEAFAGIATAIANTEKNLANARELFESYLNGIVGQRGDGWRETKLGREIDLQTGFAFKSKGYSTATDGIRLLRGDNVVPGAIRWDDHRKWSRDDAEGYSRYQLQANDIVLAMDRTWIKSGLKFAQVRTLDLPCLLVQRVARLRAGPTLNSEFLRFLIGSTKFTSYVLSIQTGLGVPHISGPQISAFEFFLPPVSEQIEIAAILDDMKSSVERLVSNYQQKHGALSELNQTLLQKAFAGELTAVPQDEIETALA